MPQGDRTNRRGARNEPLLAFNPSAAMCLVLLALATHPCYDLILAANRDEAHTRPTARAAWWPEGWLGGRDLAAGGSWLGVTAAGRWAVITNVRDPSRYDPDAPSRGALVTDLLQAPGEIGGSLEAIVAAGERHNGFNLLGGDTTRAYWGSNRSPQGRALAAGVYGLSNRLLDTPWPKVLRIKAAFAAWCARNGAAEIHPEELLAMLDDRSEAPDEELPVTGVGLERERRLSALFIVDPVYGTRCSTVLTIDKTGEARFVERSFDPGGQTTGEVAFRFSLVSA